MYGPLVETVWGAHSFPRLNLRHPATPVRYTLVLPFSKSTPSLLIRVLLIMLDAGQDFLIH